MTDKVYVVSAESGEYSDRDDWVAGVFTDKAEAERLVLEKSAERNVQKALDDAWGDLVRAKSKEFKDIPTLWERGEAAREAIGPRPKTAEWDRLYLAEVPLNVWGRFRF